MRQRTTKRSAIALVAALVAVLFITLPVGAAGAQSVCEANAQYQGSATFVANVTTVAPGGTVVFSGTGWPGSSTVAININGALVGEAPTTPTGTFTFNYVVPASTPTSTLNATAGCGTFVLSQAVGVVAANTSTSAVPVATTAATGSLPVTGTQALWGAQIAIALVAVGGLLVLVSRRREGSRR